MVIKRKLKSCLAVGLAYVCTGLALIFLGSILWTLIKNGMAGLSWQLFSQSTPGPGTEGGGLLNAMVGTVMMTSVGIAVGTPVGILAGTWLANAAPRSKLAQLIRFLNDILLSAPSILIGLFIYQMLVVTMGHFSGWAGAMALAMIALPVVVRTTEDMLRLVPAQLKEAAASLGMAQWHITVAICYRAAAMGMLTGLLLAIARISGETAPLLFTALNNQFFSMDMNGPLANLPVTIYRFAMSPDSHWNQLAWSGALLITFSILMLNLLARQLLRWRQQGTR